MRERFAYRKRRDRDRDRDRDDGADPLHARPAYFGWSLRSGATVEMQPPAVELTRFVRRFCCAVLPASCYVYRSCLRPYLLGKRQI